MRETLLKKRMQIEKGMEERLAKAAERARYVANFMVFEFMHPSIFLAFNDAYNTIDHRLVLLRGRRLFFH